MAARGFRGDRRFSSACGYGGAVIIL